MNDIVIKVEQLSKRYRIGLSEQRNDTFTGALTSWIKAPVLNYRRLRKLSKFDEQGEATDVIWALKDVSFEVKRGEVIGIVGHNGAGKTTVLKILSQITEPTSGRAVINGRVASLLEVGTGFHQELTGRENVYLNGTVLGMSKQEIDRKFDEIVAFAGVEKFIDTPVKRYSSGMQVRLAFAVAAHLEPEILLIDEVLSVGDAEFQAKCLGTMDAIAHEGRTVLFVSHNLGAVRNLCGRGIWLHQGAIRQRGDVDDVVNRYLASAQTHADTGRVWLGGRRERTGSGQVRFESFAARLAGGEDHETPRTGMDVELVLGYSADAAYRIASLSVGIAIKNAEGQPLIHVGNEHVGVPLSNLPSKGEIICRIPTLPLQPGRYYATLGCRMNGVVADKIRDVVMFEVQVGDYFGTGRLPPKKHGDLLVAHQWRWHAKAHPVEPPYRDQ